MGCSKWSLTGKCVPSLSLLKSPWTEKAISPLATFSHKGPSSHQLFADCGAHQEHEANQKLCQALGWMPVVVKFLARLYMHHLSGPSNITSDWASISLWSQKKATFEKLKWVDLKVCPLILSPERGLTLSSSPALAFSCSPHPPRCLPKRGLTLTFSALPATQQYQACTPWRLWCQDSLGSCWGRIGSSHCCATFSFLGL